MEPHLILPEDLEVARSMIGRTITHALLPEPFISRQVIFPTGASCTRSNEQFFESSSVSLRLKSKGSKKEWITLSPGPDEYLERWGSLSVKAADQPQLPKYDPSEISPLLNSDHYVTSRGYAHVTLFPHEPIQRITLLKFGLYAGWIVTHEGGEEWCAYAEYDFNFWLNFNKLPAEDLRKSADEQLIIK